MRKTSHLIYVSRRHLVFTLLVVALPFVFLLAFSRLTHIAAKTLFLDLFVSSARLGAAYVAAGVLAWSVAVTVYRGRAAVVFLPLFDVLQSFPTFAMLPLAVFFWGATSFTVIFFLVLTIIWPIFFSLISSLKLMKHEWTEAVSVSGLKGWPYVRMFLIPVSIPGFVTGSIVGLGEGWEALVATEVIVRNDIGLGSFFSAFSHDAGVTAFGVLGLLFLIFSVNKLVWLPLLEWSHHRMEE